MKTNSTTGTMYIHYDEKYVEIVLFYRQILWETTYVFGKEAAVIANFTAFSGFALALYLLDKTGGVGNRCQLSVTDQDIGAELCLVQLINVLLFALNWSGGRVLGSSNSCNEAGGVQRDPKNIPQLSLQQAASLVGSYEIWLGTIRVDNRGFKAVKLILSGQCLKL